MATVSSMFDVLWGGWGLYGKVFEVFEEELTG